MKSTALHDDMAAKLLRRGQLDDLIQSVFDHGIGKAGGNIRNRGTFFLCLLDIGIHVHSTVFQTDTFHILTANVQHTVHFWIEERSGRTVSNRFHFSVIQRKGSLQQCLSVAGRARPDDFCIPRH